MKKLIIAASLYLLSGPEVNAQFYGHKLYTNPGIGTTNAITSSAFATAAYSNGYLSCMYLPNGSRPIILRKTDRDGNFSTTDDFQMLYNVNIDHANCGNFYSPTTACAGASAIETNIGASTVGSRYAVVASVTGNNSNKFLVFFTANQTGFKVNDSYYDFPSNTSSYTKPYITEDNVSPGNYYICGSYTAGSNMYMYVLKVNISGTVTWSQTYLSGTAIEPKAIIKSPFVVNNMHEIIIVGRTVPSGIYSNHADDGFFLKLDASNGTVNLFRVYGEDLVSAEHQQFASVAPAFSSYGGAQGFVIGGFSEQLSSTPASQGTWLLKVNASTGATLWNNITDNGNLTGVIGVGTSIFERFNAGTYTYFCSTSLSAGIRAYKLSNNGTLFGSLGRFDYNAVSPISNILNQTFMTNITNSVPDNGIQLFSTDGSGNNQDNYFVKAYFDGNSGCNQTILTTQQSAGPSIIIAPTISTSTGLSQGTCVNFGVDMQSSSLASQSSYCSNTSISSASNAKQIATSLENNTTIENVFNLFPNPNNGFFYIQSNKDLKLTIINQIGQVIKTVELTSANNFKIDITDLSAGIYFVKAQGAEQEKGYKIIVEK